jgi:hypothetical protein
VSERQSEKENILTTNIIDKNIHMESIVNTEMNDIAFVSVALAGTHAKCIFSSEYYKAITPSLNLPVQVFCFLEISLSR